MRNWSKLWQGQFQIENQDNKESILKLPDCNLLVDTLQLVRLFWSMEVIKACKVHP